MMMMMLMMYEIKKHDFWREGEKNPEQVDFFALLFLLLLISFLHLRLRSSNKIRQVDALLPVICPEMRRFG